MDMSVDGSISQLMQTLNVRRIDWWKSRPKTDAANSEKLQKTWDGITLNDDYKEK